jgi:hypothetical protein
MIRGSSPVMWLWMATTVDSGRAQDLEDSL